jgi:hypothetical protein
VQHSPDQRGCIQIADRGNAQPLRCGLIQPSVYQNGLLRVREANRKNPGVDVLRQSRDLSLDRQGAVELARGLIPLIVAPTINLSIP